MKSLLLTSFFAATTLFAIDNDFHHQQQLDQLSWDLDRTRRSVDETAEQTRKLRKELERQKWEEHRRRNPVDPGLSPTVEGRARQVAEKREALSRQLAEQKEVDALAQAQREAEQANAHWQHIREIEAIEERNRIERERNAIQARKAEASRAERTTADAHLSNFERSKAIAVTRYPELSNADSKMVRLVEAIDRHWEEIEHPLYSSSDKPLILAEMAAMYLKIKASDLTQSNR